MQTVVVLLGISVATVVAGGLGSHYYYDYDGMRDYVDDEYEGAHEERPTFTATPQDFTVEVNGKITFPCDVENLGSQTLMFRHIMPNGVHKMLFVGDKLLKPDAYKFTKIDNSFVLSGIRRRHAGIYECRIESNIVTQLKHSLNVQYPATVRRISPEHQRVRKGSTVTLECAGDGNPKAAISWSKQKGFLPSGQQAVEGLNLTLHDVDRHVEGTYICTASNGVGPPSSTTMAIEVEYPPEIIADQDTLHTGEGDRAELLCVVHGRPSPSVSWQKDGETLTSEEHLRQEHDGLHKHTLTIQNVLDQDFGDYTCVAENTHGQTYHTLRITGLPKPPRITSSPSGGERDAYTITWDAESKAPITQYRVGYRKAHKDNFMGKVHGGWDDRLYSPPPPTTPLQGEGDLVISIGSTHHMSHPLRQLESATDYEAIVSVENRFGWSNSSDIFRFYTRKEVAVGQSASGCERLSLSAVLVMMLLGAFVY